MNSYTKKLSVVILCYKEEDYIPIFAAEMAKVLIEHAIPHELILVANYYKNSQNKNRSPEIARKIAENRQNIIAVTKEKKGKMGWDLRTGFEAATGDVIALTDGDGQVSPNDIVVAYEKLINKNFDIVQGERIERKDGKMRKVTSYVYGIVLRSFFPKVKIKDINGEPKIFTREKLNQMKLTADNWFADSEIVIQATYRDFKIGTIPTIFYENTRRRSTTSLWSIAESIRDIVIYRIKLIFNKKDLLS